MSGNHRAEPETSKARIAVAGALTAGALLLAPVGVAIAAPGIAHGAPPGGGSGGSTGGGGGSGGSTGGGGGTGEPTDPGGSGGTGGGVPPGGGSGGTGTGGTGPGGPHPPGGGGGGTTGPGNPGGGGSGAVGVSNRPALNYPAPLVTLSQTVGDAVFDHNPMLNSTPLGGIYHGLLGAPGTPQDTDGILEPGEAYQGAYRGVLNHVLPPTTSANRRNLTSVTDSAGVACVTGVTICK